MGTLTNQEFLYRENPVAYDGTGTITSIKGNTVSFNQLINNGNFSSTTDWTGTRGTIAVSNNILNYTLTEVGTSYNTNRINQTLYTISGHKYYATGEIYPLHDGEGGLYIQNVDGGSIIQTFEANKWQRISNVYVSNNTGNNAYRFGFNGTGYSLGDVIKYRNCMVFDLTLMGIDNLTTTAQVEAWLSSHIGDLPYYDYTQGTLIPFMGTGLKTVGKNLLDVTTYAQTSSKWSLNDGVLSSNNSNYEDCYFLLPTFGGKYTISFKTQTANANYMCDIKNADTDVRITRKVGLDLTNSITIDATPRLKIQFYGNGASSGAISIYDVQIEKGESATAYEPYISNTLSLPTLSYFPSGMKSAGSVYDELDLVNNKAYTRVGKLTLNGSEEWYLYDDNATGYRSFYTFVSSDVKIELGNKTANNYICLNTASWVNSAYSVFSGHNSLNRFYFRPPSSNSMTLAQWKTWLSSNPVTVYYDKASYTQTNISSYDLTYPIENGGTEQILPVNTSSPTTAPIICDIDYRGMTTVTTDDEPNGSGTTTGDGEYRYHSSVTVTATSTNLDAYRFSHWEDGDGNNVSNNSSYTFTIEDD